MFKSNAKYYLKSTINVSDTTGSTFKISTDFELGENLETGGDTVSIVLKNSTQIERMTITATGGTATIVKRGLTQADNKTEDVNLKKQWTDGTIIYITALASDLIDKENGQLSVYLNATARDIAIPNPSNGMQVYLTTEGYFSDYQAGAWSTGRATGTTPNASDTVAGKIEIATTAESKAGTDTGGTGALLSVLPSDIAKNTQSGTFVYGTDAGGDDTYVVALTPTLTAYTAGQRLTFTPTTANTGACSVDFGPGVLNIKTKDGNDPQSGVIRASKPVTGTYDGTNFILDNEDFATSDNKGLTEMLTDAEATTGTDETRYMNAKQAKDNYGIRYGTASNNLKASSDGVVSSISPSYNKAKEIQLGMANGTIRVSFALASQDSNTVYGRIYKNGVAVGTERSVSTTGYSTFTEDFSYSIGDLIQLYIRNNLGIGVNAKEFRIYYDRTYFTEDYKVII